MKTSREDFKTGHRPGGLVAAAAPIARRLVLTSLVLSTAGIVLLDVSVVGAQTARPTMQARRAPEYFRLQLKYNQKYLDAKQCTDDVGMNPGSDFASGACQLWRLVPVADGWSRLQLKHNQKYLDARQCSNNVGLNAGSDYADGACQLWRLVPVADGWSRLQLKNGGKYLDAKYCTDDVGMNPGSDYDGGACQLWRLVPEHTAAMTRMIEQPARPVVRPSTGISERADRAVISGGVLGTSQVPDAAGAPARRGFDESGQPYLEERLPDGSVKRIQQNGITIIAPDGTKRFVPNSVIRRSNAQPATPPTLPDDPGQGRLWLERHNEDLLDLIRGLVHSDEAEMSKFDAGERKEAVSDLFAQISYRTRVADFLALDR